MRTRRLDTGCTHPVLFWQMKTLRFRILFAAFLIATALVSSGWIWPLSLIFGEPKNPGHDLRPKITVEGLEKKYGAPVYHRTYDTPVTDGMGFVKLPYDEEIAFKMGKNLVVYYFSKGKLVASALKNKVETPESTESEETAEPAPANEVEALPAEPQEEPPTSNIMERF